MFRLATRFGQGLALSSRAQSPSITRPFSAVTSNSSSIDMKNLGIQSGQQTIIRSLFSEAGLNIESLDYFQNRKKELFAGGARERFVERLSDYLRGGDTGSIYKDDLVNLIGIADDESDLDLLEQIVEKVASKQSVLFEGWGAQACRLYYKMNKLDRAYKNIKDIERFGDFFSLQSCYKIIMTMLYDAGRYEDVLELLELSRTHLKSTRSSQETSTESAGTLDRDLLKIAFASLAKMNNLEALEKGQAYHEEFFKHMKSAGLRPTSFIAYIAVMNNQPKIALNLISQTAITTYVTLRELKLLALLKLERFEDILIQLREYASFTRRESNLMLKTTIDALQESVPKIQDVKLRNELQSQIDAFKEGGHISNTTIEEWLFKPLNLAKQPMRADQPRGSGQFRPRYNDGQQPHSRSRPHSDSSSNSRHNKNYYNKRRYPEGDESEDASGNYRDNGEKRTPSRFQNMGFD